METTIYIETDRLILRGWEETDREVFAMMNSNPNVMRHFPATLDPEESDRFISRITSELEEYGYGLFAVELKGSGDFIGYVGFHRFCFDVPFSPGWEIGWRLSDRHWHKGYATEAATACIAYARQRGLFKRLYSFTAVSNTPSENVMKRVGMTARGRFQHPYLPDGHRLKEHLLYAIDL